MDNMFVRRSSVISRCISSFATLEFIVYTQAGVGWTAHREQGDSPLHFERLFWHAEHAVLVIDVDGLRRLEFVF